MATRAEVYAALDGEREYQGQKWGTSNSSHKVESWILWMHDYLREAAHQATRSPEPAGSQAALHTIRKVAALAVACMENLGAPPREGCERPSAGKTTMIYGHDRTIHRTTRLDVEVGPDGRVCGVWFRCAMLPFKESRVDDARAADLKRSMDLPAILAVELADR